MKNNILICGFGNIGIQIALEFLINNNNIYIFDKKKLHKKLVIELFEQYLSIKNDLTKKKIQKDLQGFMDNINIIQLCHIKDKNIDFIFECIDENLKNKIKFYKEINCFLNKNTIISTSSTVFMPEIFCNYLTNAKIFCATHFYAPSFDIKSVDLRPHKRTDINIIKRIEILLNKNGFHTEKINTNNMSYIFNSILDNMFLSALELHIDQGYNIEKIDNIWKKNSYMHKGPFELMDIIGIDTVYKITKILTSDNFNNKIVSFLKSKINKKELGVKTGKGFYKYPYFDNVDYF